MPKYTYTAKEENGNLVENSIEAKSRYEALAILKERGLTVVSLSSSILDDEEAEEKPAISKNKKRRFFSGQMNIGELAVFCRQLSVSLNSGVSLIDALQSIAEDMDNFHFQQILFDVISQIQAGKHFSEAIAVYKEVFTPLFVALVRSAEESGSIPQILEYLSLYLEKSVSLNQKIRSITTYPLFIVVFFLIVVMIVTFFILPRFETIFSDFGAQLPKFTRIVFGINRFFIIHISVFIVATIGLVIGFIVYGRSVIGRYHIDKLKLKLPFFGKLIKKTSIARFCRVLAVMIRGGVSIETAIEIASKVCSNKVLEKSLEQAKDQIVDGADIATSLGRDGNFPRLVGRMVSVGESSGRLPEVLDKVSDMYEEQVEGSIMVATSLFEPTVIVIFGGVILLLVLAIYVPVFKIATSAQGG